MSLALRYSVLCSMGRERTDWTGTGWQSKAIVSGMDCECHRCTSLSRTLYAGKYGVAELAIQLLFNQCKYRLLTAASRAIDLSRSTKLCRVSGLSAVPGNTSACNEVKVWPPCVPTKGIANPLRPICGQFDLMFAILQQNSGGLSSR